MIQELLIPKLKTKTGLDFIRHKDCNILSDLIFNETGERVSPSTLKRFTGIVSTKSQPSQHTLHVLSQFLGYDSIEAFTNHIHSNAVNGKRTDQQPDPKESFFELQTQTNRLSDLTADFMWEKGLFHRQQLIIREHEQEQFRNFLDSSATIWPIVGPGGSGKSVFSFQLYKSIRQQWKSEDTLMLYLTGSQLSQHQNLLEQIDGFGTQPVHTSIELWLKEDKNRAFFLIADALDEMPGSWNEVQEITKTLFHISERYKDFPNVHLIFTMRDTFWELLGQHRLLPENEALLYLNESEDDVFYRSIPPFSRDEAQKVLAMHHRTTTLEELDRLDPIDRQLLREPFYCQLIPDILDELGNKPLLNIPHHIAQHLFFHHADALAVTRYLHRFIELSMQNNGKAFVRLQQILGNSEIIDSAHQFLVDQGIIVEHTLEGTLSTLRAVEFRHQLFYDYAYVFHHYHREPISASRIKHLLETHIDYPEFNFFVSQLFYFLLEDGHTKLIETLLLNAQTLTNYLASGRNKKSNIHKFNYFILKILKHLPDLSRRLILNNITNPQVRFVFFEMTPTYSASDPLSVTLFQAYFHTSTTRQERIFSQSILLHMAIDNLDASSIRQHTAQLDNLGVDIEKIYPFPNMRSLGYRLISKVLLGESTASTRKKIHSFSLEAILKTDFAKQEGFCFYWFQYLLPCAFVTGEWDYMYTLYTSYHRYNTKSMQERLNDRASFETEFYCACGAYLHTHDEEYLKRAQECYTSIEKNFTDHKNDDFRTNLYMHLFSARLYKEKKDEHKIAYHLREALRFSKISNDWFYEALILLLLNEKKACLEIPNVDEDMLSRIQRFVPMFWEGD